MEKGNLCRPGDSRGELLNAPSVRVFLGHAGDRRVKSRELPGSQGFTLRPAAASPLPAGSRSALRCLSPRGPQAICYIKQNLEIWSKKLCNSNQLKIKTRVEMGVNVVDEVMIPLSRQFRSASEIVLEIHVVEAVSKFCAHSPFKIIKYRPVEVPFDLYTIPITNATTKLS